MVEIKSQTRSDLKKCNSIHRGTQHSSDRWLFDRIFVVVVLSQVPSYRYLEISKYHGDGVQNFAVNLHWLRGCN